VLNEQFLNPFAVSMLPVPKLTVSAVNRMEEEVWTVSVAVPFGASTNPVIFPSPTPLLLRVARIRRVNVLLEIPPDSSILSTFAGVRHRRLWSNDRERDLCIAWPALFYHDISLA